MAEEIDAVEYASVFIVWSSSQSRIVSPSLLQLAVLAALLSWRLQVLEVFATVLFADDGGDM